MATVAELEARIVKLEKRIAEAEDERAIRELLARYGYTADVCKDKEYVDLYTEDGAMDLGSGGVYAGIRRWEGKQGIWQFITDPKGHHDPNKYGKRMHVQGNNVVCHIKGTTAIVNSYSIVLLGKDGGQVILDSAGNNQWTLKKIRGKWYIKERRRRHVAGTDYHTNLDATPA